MELESGLTPKYRSMEKLTRLNPDIAILVVARGTLSDQYEKLDDMLQSGGRYLYLVSLEESYYWTRNDLTM